MSTRHTAIYWCWHHNRTSWNDHQCDGWRDDFEDCDITHAAVVEVKAKWLKGDG